ncbi:MAG: MBL fold metallo-hydrolase [Pseudolabrys sp.]|nr:MBL fold metallo-hydrolase [Pseudolabrys sp.]MBV9953770.1 MBL fold metallo-hydrolase [Pseudolabrys sp.]
MTDLTRRTAMVGAVSAAAIAPLVGATRASAASPPVGKQNGGWYRYKVGDAEVTVVTDGARSFPIPDGFIANAGKDDINKALEAAHQPKDKITLTFTPIVVNSGGKLYLIDTGYGEKAYTENKGIVGQLRNNLQAAGINPDSIDAVIISHYHGDHVDGLVLADGSPTFKNAEVLVPAVEHKFWMDDGEMSRAPKGRMEGLFKNNRRVFSGDILKRVRTYDWDKEVAPGITAIATPGHTLGHTSFVVSSGSSKVFVQSDVTNLPALFVRNPGWHANFDQVPDMAETTRRKTYDMLVAEKLMVQAFHYPFPSLAYVEKAGSGYRESLVPWNPTI